MDKNAAEARRAYMRVWRSKNPEKVRAANENYWQRRAEKIMAKQQAAKEAADGGKNDES